MDQAKIGKFIGELRKEKKLKQAELAEKLGVTSKTVSRWETGKYMPDLSLFTDISQILVPRAKPQRLLSMCELCPDFRFRVLAEHGEHRFRT